MKIGVQTFTIRKSQKKDIEQAYLPLIQMGIHHFEIGRMDWTESNAYKIKKLMDQHAFDITSIQVKPKDVFHHMEAVVRFCHIVGCNKVVISMLPFHCILGSEKQFYQFIGTLDAAFDEYQKLLEVMKPLDLLRGECFDYHSMKYTLRFIFRIRDKVTNI